MKAQKNDRTPVVLVHGTGASLHTWDGWVSGLKSKRRVIRFDLPGFGLTGPEPQNNYTIEKYTDHLVKLLNHLGIAHAIVAGNSLLLMVLRGNNVLKTKERDRHCVCLLRSTIIS